MKKETIITAILFFGVGFLSGYIFDAHRKSTNQQSPASVGASGPAGETAGEGAGTPGSSPGMTTSGLPEGHPPVDTAALTKSLEEEAARKPSDPEPRLKLGNFFYDQKQYDQAIGWYRRALELDPKNINAQTDLGTAYFYIGRPQDALREYRKSLAIDPTHEPTLFNLIVVYLDGKHDLARAQETWTRLQELNPSYPRLESLKQRLDAARASGGGTRATQ